jgi:hypothetical protein
MKAQNVPAASGSPRRRTTSHWSMSAARPFILTLGALALAGSAGAQCPAAGNDTGCGILITITNQGATVSPTGQGPYDGADDTLIGVINNSTLPVSSLELQSGLDIFGFDGDGIDSFGIAGNGMDGTGYGGPNAYFTDYSADPTRGKVHFITPIPANGGTGFFSLENALSSATACSSVLNNAVPKPAGGGTVIRTTFTPNLGYTLAQAAQLCGFIEFDWQQTIRSWPLPSSLFAAGIAAPLHAPPRFNDPPPNGYAYQNPPNAVQLAVYWNLFMPASYPLSLAANETSTTLSFIDNPAEPCLPGGSGGPCGGQTSPAGSKLAFTTHLVGIAGALPGASVVDTGIGFDWTDTFNGTSGGIAVANSIVPVDPGSGTGGITVTAYYPTTTLQGVTVTSVNGGKPGAVPTLSSGTACDGVFSGTFNGGITVFPGQSCTFVDGTITGDVQQKGGTLVLSGDLVGGSINVKGGSFTIDSFSEVHGGINVQKATAVLNSVCDSTIFGTMQIHNNTSPIQIGSSSAATCGSNALVSDLVVFSNSSSTSIVGNVVSGSLNAYSNGGSTAVFGNSVAQTLQCSANSSITGGLNSAAQKQGQCAAF